MTHDGVQQWLDRYIAAWESRDADQIGELFAEDAVYDFRPWRSEKHTADGRDAIVAAWLEDDTDPSAWEAEYAPYAVEGDRAVAVGWTRYDASGDHSARTYHNAFLLRFGDDGRCSEFTEFFVLERD